MTFFQFLKKPNKKSKFLAEAIIETEEVTLPNSFSASAKKRLGVILNNKKVFIGGGALVIATFLANILNYIFNAFLGRVLSFNEFALIGLISGLYSFSSIFFGAFSTTVNYRSGFLIGKYGDSAGYNFWKYTRKIAIYPSILFTIIWIIAIPFLSTFFHTDNIYLFASFWSCFTGRIYQQC